MTGRPRAIKLGSLLHASSPTRQKLRRWHQLCGIGGGVLLIVTALSGSVLVYKKPVIQWFAAPAATLPARYSINSVARDLDVIQQRYAPEDLQLLKAPNPEEPYWTLVKKSGDRYLLATGTLKVLTHNHWILSLLEWLRVFHTELLAGIVGELVLFVMSLTTLFLLFSGVILWWPARKRLKLRWLIPLRVKARYLMQYHRHLGGVSAPIIILVIVTGGVMLAQRLDHWFETRFAPPVTPAEQPYKPRAAQFPPIKASELLSNSAGILPDAWPTYIRLPSSENAQARFRFRLDGEWHPNGRSTVTVSAVDKSINNVERSDQASPVRKVLNQMYPLHSSYGLNAVYSLLVFTSGLACCWLAITGVTHWWRRRTSR